MNRNVISVGTTEDQETVANLFAKYDLTVLPVVDNEKRIVGIVTVDDAIDVLQRETTEDIEKNVNSSVIFPVKTFILSISF